VSFSSYISFAQKLTYTLVGDSEAQSTNPFSPQANSYHTDTQQIPSPAPVPIPPSNATYPSTASSTASESLSGVATFTTAVSSGRSAKELEKRVQELEMALSQRQKLGEEMPRREEAERRVRDEEIEEMRAQMARLQGEMARMRARENERGGVGDDAAPPEYRGSWRHH
jgi:hypothetical protein